jgi:hypothetical protein
MEGFEEYLVRKAFIQEKYVPYYLKWVYYCYSFTDQPDTCLLTSDQVQNYLNHISKTREDWQVQQAEAALRLYGYYLSLERKKPGDAGKAGVQSGTRDLTKIPRPRKLADYYDLYPCCKEECSRREKSS